MSKIYILCRYRSNGQNLRRPAPFRPKSKNDIWRTVWAQISPVWKGFSTLFINFNCGRKLCRFRNLFWVQKVCAKITEPQHTFWIGNCPPFQGRLNSEIAGDKGTTRGSKCFLEWNLSVLVISSGISAEFFDGTFSLCTAGRGRGH